MDVEAHVKATNVEPGDNKKANLENVDVYRQQYHHLLAWSTSVTKYEQSFFNGKFSAGNPVRPTTLVKFIRLCETDRTAAVNISILFPSIPASALRLTVSRSVTADSASRNPGSPPTVLFYAVLLAIPGAADIRGLPEVIKSTQDKAAQQELPVTPARHILLVGPAVAYTPAPTTEAAAENRKFNVVSSSSKWRAKENDLQVAKEKAIQLFVEKVEDEVNCLVADMGGIVTPWEGNLTAPSSRGKEGLTTSSESIASGKRSRWLPGNVRRM
jgi:hypothetical protein